MRGRRSRIRWTQPGQLRCSTRSACGLTRAPTTTRARHGSGERLRPARRDACRNARAVMCRARDGRWCTPGEEARLTPPRLEPADHLAERGLATSSAASSGSPAVRARSGRRAETSARRTRKGLIAAAEQPVTRPIGVRVCRSSSPDAPSRGGGVLKSFDLQSGGPVESSARRARAEGPVLAGSWGRGTLAFVHDVGQSDREAAEAGVDGDPRISTCSSA